MTPVSKLTTVFLRERGAGESAADPAMLEAALADACARARAAFPELAYDDAAFVGDLGRVVNTSDPAAVAVLAIEDLFLVAACLANIAGAVETFRGRYRETIRSAVGRLVPAGEVDEVEQHLLDQMLMGSVTAVPKVRGYAGRAPLDRWIAVAAQRAALIWLREHKTEARARSAAAREPAAAGQVGPETAFLKQHYQGHFQHAMTEALQRLPERERLLLRLHLVNGVSLEKVGKMFGVTQPTVSRWLAAAREALRDDMKKTLGARLGSNSSEVASLAGMVASRLDVSISMFLHAK